jgi:tetratricopeptide (TPR) repeat protein
MPSKGKNDGGAGARAAIDPIELERRRLAIVLGDETGFRLYLATYNEPQRRDDLVDRLTGELAERGVSVTRLDVSGAPLDSSLADLLRRHLEEQALRGARIAVMVVGIEQLIERRSKTDDFGFLERANIQREALPEACPAPVVLWLTPGLSAALPKVATDLWHWRAATFEFTSGAGQRTDVLRQITDLPIERRQRLRTAERAERAALLEDLLEELDRRGPPSTRRELAERITLLDELGESMLDLGRGSAAKPFFEREIKLAEESGDAGARARALIGLGDTATYLGDLGGAMAAYQRAFKIREGQVAQDPSNSEWQRDLSISFDKIGDLQSARGNLDAALKAFQDSLDIRERLSAQDPSNSEWQRDLSVSFERIGDLQSARGKLDAAHKAIQHSHDNRERLATQDPSNSQWQRDLIVSHWKLAEIAEQQDGRGGAALRHYRSALEIAVALQQGGRLAPVDAWIVGVLDEHVARVREAGIA